MVEVLPIFPENHKYLGVCLSFSFLHLGLNVKGKPEGFLQYLFTKPHFADIPDPSQKAPQLPGSLPTALVARVVPSLEFDKKEAKGKPTCPFRPAFASVTFRASTTSASFRISQVGRLAATGRPANGSTGGGAGGIAGRDGSLGTCASGTANSTGYSWFPPPHKKYK